MELLVFDAMGFFAHFRKFYSTSSSLSYAFPPRSAILGMLAATLGREKDSYYEEFSLEKCRVAVALRTPVRKIVQQINYLDTDMISEERLRGRTQRVPTALEFVLPEPPNTSVKYRVFIHHYNLDEVCKRIKSGRFVYPPSLGLSGCLASLNFISLVQAEVRERPEPIEVSTVIPASRIEDIAPNEGVKIYREEQVPISFSTGRKIERLDDFVYEGEGKQLKVRVRGESFKCELAEGTIYGVFME
ncbi:MAG: CRISPR-associated protein Cas5 [Candidatus Jordarchaeaceae archaeon]